MAILTTSAKQITLLVVLLLSTSLYAQNLTLTSGPTRTTAALSEQVTVVTVDTTITINTTTVTITQSGAPTGDGFIFASLGVPNLYGAYASQFIPQPSTITLPPSLSSVYAKCHNNCTIYPGTYERWTWYSKEVSETVTLATEFIVVDPIHNLTSTSIKYNTEVLSKYPLPTNTNSDGTQTVVISNTDYFAGTPVFVTL